VLLQPQQAWPSLLYKACQTTCQVGNMYVQANMVLSGLQWSVCVKGNVT